MKGRVGAVCFILILAGHVGAGELVLTNGSRLEGELVNEVLVVSTGADLIEIQPEQVGLLTAEEIWLRDGRVIRGTLVGDHLKIRTPIGEIGVKSSELHSFRVEPVVRMPPHAPGGAPVVEAAVAAEEGTQRRLVGAPPTDRGQSSVMPYQPPTREDGLDASPPPAVPAQPTLAVLAPEATSSLKPGRRLEVVVIEANLRRDALANADPVGRVVRGEHVIYVDFIDRRLRILNMLIYDGGHWVKVQAGDGTVGWLPAKALREVP